MTRAIVAGWLVATLVWSGIATARNEAPAACACQADSGVVWAEVAMTEDNLAALRRSLSASGLVLEGQVLTMSNRCPDPRYCADRDWKPLGTGPFRLEITGHMSSPGLFDDKRLRLEALTTDATLTLMGWSR